MGRSLKKGPYVDPKLLKKIETMNRAGDRKVIKTWAPDFQQYVKLQKDWLEEWNKTYGYRQ